MATVYEVVDRREDQLLHVYQGLSSGEAGDPINLFEHHHSPFEIWVQVSGTLGGGTVQLEGSLNSNDYTQLSDRTGTSIAPSTSGEMIVLSGAPRFIRPRLVGGTNGDAVVHVLLNF